jgi:hypothetical protein
MKYLALVVVFTALVVYGEEPKTKTDAHAHKATSTVQQTDDMTGRTVIVVNQQAPAGQQESHPSKPPSYLSRLFSPENLPNIALVIVGALTLLAIWYQAKKTADATEAMQRQVTEMSRQREVMFGQLRVMQEQVTEVSSQTDVLERSVAAAKASADIAIGVSIPTLVVHDFKTWNLVGIALPAVLKSPRINLVIKNYGQTPALLRSWTLIFTCEDLPDVPIYSGQKGCGIVLTKETIQSHGGIYTLTIETFLHRQELSPGDVEDIIERRKLLTAYGYVCYGDIFGNPLRRFKFCETALNVTNAWIDWRSEFAPAAYVGTDLLPSKKTND